MRIGRHRDLLPYLLVLPLLVCELVVHVVPTLLGVLLSLRHVDQFNLGSWTRAPYTGTANYRTALDPGSAIGSALLSSLGITIAFTLIVVVLSWALGMFGAVLLSLPFRGRGFVRAFLLIPFALPAYVTSVGWRFLLAHDNGAVNHLLVDNLHLLGTRPFWLIGDHAFWATVMVSVWRLWPFACLMLSASLAAVPRELYEVAALNGANAWGQFRLVTLPTIRRANVLVLLVMTLWTFNEFAVPWVLFGGTPPQSATLLSTLVYREAFGTFDIGVAAATNVMVTVLLLLVGLAWVRRTIAIREIDR